MPNEFDPQVAVAFGRNLREARKKKGVSQEKLAWATGLHRTTMGFLENGERVPRIDTFLRLAEELEVEPAALLKGVKPTAIPRTGPLR
jgi:transcriptional regulator with XRE-family HTH domain